MNDERAEKVITGALMRMHQGRTARFAAKDILAALRVAGYDLYRPDECVDAVCYPTATGHVVSVRQRVPEGHYSLVPVGGEG